MMISKIEITDKDSRGYRRLVAYDLAGIAFCGIDVDEDIVIGSYVYRLAYKKLHEEAVKRLLYPKAEYWER